MQGHLRGKPVSITVETECAHCSEPMTLHIDSEMDVTADQPSAAPMVFTPDAPIWDTEAPSIVDDF